MNVEIENKKTKKKKIKGKSLEQIFLCKLGRLKYVYVANEQPKFDKMCVKARRLSFYH